MFYMSSYRVSFACVSQGLAIKIIGQGLQAMTTLKCGKKHAKENNLVSQSVCVRTHSIADNACAEQSHPISVTTI